MPLMRKPAGRPATFLRAVRTARSSAHGLSWPPSAPISNVSPGHFFTCEDSCRARDWPTGIGVLEISVFRSSAGYCVRGKTMARHHARWRPLTEAEETAAVAGLRALAGGRGDLLAEVAEIFEGTSEGELDEPLARCAAGLCRKAGADPEAIPAWIEEGRRRAARASQPPFSGGLRAR